jgi:AcrR family transcriptional regulator
MSRKPAAKRPRVKQRRLSPDDRRKEFVAKATEFFAEEGFGGGTRALARRLGVTQPLLYRYFPSKDDLIREVYRTVYLEPLDSGWEKSLSDRTRPIRERLKQFYDAYTEVIFTRKWIRIYLYSGLKGLDLNGTRSCPALSGSAVTRWGCRRKTSRVRPNLNWPGYFTAEFSITAFANSSTRRRCSKASNR